MSSVCHIRQWLSLSAIIGCLLITQGCSNSPSSDTKTATKLSSATPTAPVLPNTRNDTKRNVTLLEKVVWNAQKQQGIQYRWGGTNPNTGFDCSGLTQYAFQKGAGVSIPRTAAAQYAAATKISPTQARKGDLVFFNTHGRGVSHVGVYLGQNKFLHAPRTGKAITTSALDGYWQRTLVGFGRIPGACRPAFS